MARIEFEWDPVKAVSNKTKHGVAFDEAMLVFTDPLALSRVDDEPGVYEERWVTIGSAGPRRLLLVVHANVESNDDTIIIRIISARRPTRRPTRRETRQYAEG
jgi:uncharacterized DUF497 family protein